MLDHIRIGLLLIPIYIYSPLYAFAHNLEVKSHNKKLQPKILFPLHHKARHRSSLSSSNIITNLSIRESKVTPMVVKGPNELFYLACI